MNAKSFCHTCRFWEKIDDSFGACRRRAPGPVRQEVNDELEKWAIWPATGPDDWCGDWKALPQPPTPPKPKPAPPAPKPPRQPPIKPPVEDTTPPGLPPPRLNPVKRRDWREDD